MDLIEVGAASSAENDSICWFCVVIGYSATIGLLIYCKDFSFL